MIKSDDHVLKKGVLKNNNKKTTTKTELSDFFPIEIQGVIELLFSLFNLKKRAGRQGTHL